MRGTADLWHAAGRAARDDRKRLMALQGVLWSGPVLVLGAVLAHLPDPSLMELRRPLAYVLDPLASAWRADHDLALLGYVLLQALLLTLLWGWFGGAVSRMAAVELATGRRENARTAMTFAKRHWRAFVGGRVALWLGVLTPLAVAAGVAAGGRLPGVLGTAILIVAAVACVLMAAFAVLVLTVTATGGFLAGPTVAAEDSDAFDAVTRPFTYVAAGLPRLLALRLLFLGGVLLGTGWRLLRVFVIAVVAVLCLRAGAGADSVDRALAVLDAAGMPPDAARLGVTMGDVILAVVLAMAAGLLLALWLADLCSRLSCARMAVYLLLRRDIDRVPLDRLRTRPQGRTHQGAEEAGFVE
ncbi:MAG: hypothetical protein ACYTG6_11610, partial [Planctomycetota bacterium]